MTRTVYSQTGEKAGEVSLPEEAFGVEINKDLLYQAVRSYEANRRQGTAHTKTRSEVAGGGRKPWPQKGTGRARHGSIRSPLWKGGGTTFGPRREKKHKVRLPKKMRRQALFTAVSSKAADRELFILKEVSLEEGKTKEMRELLEGWRKEVRGWGDGVVLLALDLSDSDGADWSVVRAARNLSDLRTRPVHTLNALEVLRSKYLVFTEDSLNSFVNTFV